jgi:sugar phosphate isomerase/epimerase
VKDSDDDKTKLDKLGQMAGLFENASKTVSGLKLTTTELKKFATDYVTMADSLAKNARALAGATKEILGMASSPGGLEAASEEFGKVCEVAANMGDCAPIAEKMAAFPQDEEPATAGPKIVAFAKEFEALTAKKQPVKDVLEKLKVEINKHGVTMTRLAELVKKSEDAQKEMEGLVKQEDTIVDALNGFCGGK